MSTGRFTTLFALLSILVIVDVRAAGEPELAYSPTYKDPIDFSRQMIKALSGGMGKWLGSLNNDEVDKPDWRRLSAHFVPTSGIGAIGKSFSNYCSGVGGVYARGLCATEDESRTFFYVETELVKVVEGDQVVDMVVWQPQQEPGSALFDFAVKRGYQTRASARLMQNVRDLAALQKQQRALDEEKRKAGEQQASEQRAHEELARNVDE